MNIGLAINSIISIRPALNQWERLLCRNWRPIDTGALPIYTTDDFNNCSQYQKVFHGKCFIASERGSL